MFHLPGGETQPDFPESTAGSVDFVSPALEALAVNTQDDTSADFQVHKNNTKL